MDYKELSNELGKSISTLKRWKKKVEELSDYKFQEQKVLIGRGKKYQVVPIFTEEEVNKFKKVAELIIDKGQDGSIIEVWGNSKTQFEQKIQDRLMKLSRNVFQNKKEIEMRVCQLKKESQLLNQEILEVKKEIKSLKENNKRRGLFK